MKDLLEKCLRAKQIHEESWTGVMYKISIPLASDSVAENSIEGEIISHLLNSAWDDIVTWAEEMEVKI